MSQQSATESKVFTSEEYPRKSIDCTAGATDIDTASNYARLITSPSLAALRVLKATEGKTNIGDLIDVPSLMNILAEQAAAVNRNDLTHVEAMLMNQATALQSLFVRLTEKGLNAEYVSNFEASMKMALRAQSQCRASLETLAAIKNPPVVIAKQANVTSGPQQINNGVDAPSPTRENETKQTKLSGEKNELLPDTGTPCFESQANPTMEAVGKIHRAKVRRG